MKMQMIKDFRSVVACLTLVTMLYSPVSWFVVSLSVLFCVSVLYYVLLGMENPRGGAPEGPPRGIE